MPSLAGAELVLIGGCGGGRWESLAVADLKIVGRRGVRICLWSRIWDSLVVAELLVVGGGGASNSTLWRSWDSSAEAELGFVGGG